MNLGVAATKGPFAALLMATSALLASIGDGNPTAALLSDTASVPGNTIATADCFRAELDDVQSGTATSSANGTLTVSISTVDTTRAFLMFQTRHNSNRPVGSTVRGRIASATSLEFVRVTNESPVATINIRWYVVEYACGVRVQRGTFTGLSSPVNVSISPVKSTAQAFATWSKTPSSADTGWDQNDALLGELTSTSNLQFRSDGGISAHVVWWEVVEFTNAADVGVQSGSTSLTGSSLSTTVTLPAAVDPAKTFVLVGFRSPGSGVDVGARLIRAELTNSTTITIDRSASGSPDSITEIVWQAVELNDGSSVQRGSASFASGVATATAALTSIRLDRAAAFASVQAPGGLSMGRSPYTTDDVVGVASVTTTLAQTQLTLTRDSTAAAADVGWFVVEWGRPWWNSSYTYRNQITVTASAAGAPDAYAVPIALDHAALVAAAKAQADGDDLRVLYWDGSAWVELDRVLDDASAWNGTGTTLRFKTRASLAAGGADHDYYLYYGNAAAGAPPANKANVYLAYDDFTGDTVDQTPAGWTVQSGGPWHAVADGTNTILRRKATGGTTGRQYIRFNGVSTADVYVQARIRMTAGASEDLACVFVRGAGTGAADVAGYRMCLQENGGRFHQRAKFVGGSFSNIEQTAYSWADATWYRVAGAVYGSTLRQWIDGTLVGTNTDASLAANGTLGVFAFVGSQIDHDVDDFLARPYVNPEPTTSLGPEVT